MKTRSAYNPTSTTKAYYMLNGNSNDISGQNNTGTDTAITYPQGKFGQAAKFDGSTSYIKLTNNFSDWTVHTISVWVKASNTGNGDILFDGDSNSGNDFQFAVTKNSVTIRGDKSGYTLNSTYSLPYDISNTWANIIWVMDSSGSKVFFNGNLLASTSTTGSNIGYHYQPQIGRLFDGVTNSEFLNGFLDEVIIESRAWTAAEVSTYYRKSMLNYGVRKAWFNFPGISYILSAATGTYNLAGQSNILNRVINLICSAGSYALTGFTISFTRLHGYIIEARTGFYNLIGGVISLAGSGSWKWNKQTKNNSTFTNKTKNSSSWNEQIKN